MKKLLETLQIHIPISNYLIKNIAEIVVKRNFRAKVKIISPIQDQSSLLFLTKGVTRNYYKSEEREWTSRFSQAGDFVLSVDNFLFNLPCNEFIESCTPVEFIELPKTHYLQLLIDNPELYVVASNVANESLRISIDRMRDWQMQSAAERYHLFVRQYPNLYKQVQLQHIASYLGITPYNLSRIRNQYKERIITLTH